MCSKGYLQELRSKQVSSFRYILIEKQIFCVGYSYNKQCLQYLRKSFFFVKWVFFQC